MDNVFSECSCCGIMFEAVGKLCKQCEMIMEASKKEEEEFKRIISSYNSCIACDAPTLNKEVCENCLLKLIVKDQKKCKTCDAFIDSKFAYCLKCITAYNAKKQACKNHTKKCPNFTTPDKPYCNECRKKHRAGKQ